MADLKIDIASVFSGKKAFADAAKSTINLNSQVKNLAKSYLGLFTAQQLARRSFDAAKAFAADDKAARVLPLPRPPTKPTMGRWSSTKAACASCGSQSMMYSGPAAAFMRSALCASVPQS